MILIPEQVQALRRGIITTQNNITNYENYFKSCEKSTPEPGFINFVDRNLEENGYKLEKKRQEAYQEALETSEFIYDINNSKIEYGTKFVFEYSETGEKQVCTLVQTLLGLEGSCFEQDNCYISIKSPLGQSVLGKRKGENFSYTLLKENKNTVTITGKIVEIIKRSKNDVYFIMSKSESARIAESSRIWRRNPYQINNIKTSDRLNEITPSQYKLLEEERMRLTNSLLRLKKYQDKIMVGTTIKLEMTNGKIEECTIVDDDDCNLTEKINANGIMISKVFNKKIGDYIKEEYHYVIDDRKETKRYVGKIIEIDNSLISQEESVYSNILIVYARLMDIDTLLRNATIAPPPTNQKVGIGSKVSIFTFENGQVQNRRVEIINHAVSTELSSDYIEAISPLGQAILGLGNNEKFNYYYEGYNLSEGIVYDINNNILEKTASSPLVYQKQKRG